LFVLCDIYTNKVARCFPEIHPPPGGSDNMRTLQCHPPPLGAGTQRLPGRSPFACQDVHVFVRGGRRQRRRRRWQFAALLAFEVPQCLCSRQCTYICKRQRRSSPKRADKNEVRTLIAPRDAEVRTLTAPPAPARLKCAKVRSQSAGRFVPGTLRVHFFHTSGMPLAAAQSRCALRRPAAHSQCALRFFGSCWGAPTFAVYEPTAPSPRYRTVSLHPGVVLRRGIVPWHRAEVR
jgi:hypothetical protein